MTRSGRPRVPSRSEGRQSHHIRSGLEEVSHVVRSRTARSTSDRPAKCDSTGRECCQKILDAASDTPRHSSLRRLSKSARLRYGCNARAVGSGHSNPSSIESTLTLCDPIVATTQCTSSWSPRVIGLAANPRRPPNSPPRTPPAAPSPAAYASSATSPPPRAYSETAANP